MAQLKKVQQLSGLRNEYHNKNILRAAKQTYTWAEKVKTNT